MLYFLSYSSLYIDCLLHLRLFNCDFIALDTLFSTYMIVLILVCSGPFLCFRSYLIRLFTQILFSARTGHLTKL